MSAPWIRAIILTSFNDVIARWRGLCSGGGRMRFHYERRPRTLNTRLVANGTDAYFFFDADPTLSAAASRTLKRLFDVDCLSRADVDTGLSAKRPDLILARTDWAAGRAVTTGGLVAPDPRSSIAIRKIAGHADLDWRQFLLVGDRGEFDLWDTPQSEMSGGLPEVLYHGTTSKWLPDVQEVGLTATGVRNHNGGGCHLYFSVTPQIAAVHARHAVDKQGGEAIVLECRRPSNLETDHDVQRDLVDNIRVPSNDADTLSLEAGLFAVATTVSPDQILRVLKPELRTPFDRWRTHP